LLLSLPAGYHLNPIYSFINSQLKYLGAVTLSLGSFFKTQTFFRG